MGYSLFSEYLESTKNYLDIKLEEYEGDFFVYTEKNGDTWSGYFTTKPRIKNRIRNIGKYMRALELIYPLTK